MREFLSQLFRRKRTPPPPDAEKEITALQLGWMLAVFSLSTWQSLTKLLQKEIARKRKTNADEVFMLAVAVTAWAAGRDRLMSSLSETEQQLAFESFFAFAWAAATQDPQEFEQGIADSMEKYERFLKAIRARNEEKYNHYLEVLSQRIDEYGSATEARLRRQNKWCIFPIDESIARRIFPDLGDAERLDPYGELQLDSHLVAATKATHNALDRLKIKADPNAETRILRASTLGERADTEARKVNVPREIVSDDYAPPPFLTRPVILTCPKCGARNRVNPFRLDEAVQHLCGRCNEFLYDPFDPPRFPAEANSEVAEEQSPSPNGLSSSQAANAPSAESAEEEKLILSCSKCGAKNRLPASRRSEAVCGRCHNALSLDGESVQSTERMGTGEQDGLVLRSRVRALRAEGRSERDIALELGVTVATVDGLVREMQREGPHNV